MKSMQFLAGTAQAQGAVFYFLDENLDSGDYVTLGIDSGIHNYYVNNFGEIDPLHARHYIDTGRNVVTAGDLPRRLVGKWNVYANEFLKPCGLAHIVEIFLRNETGIFAGLSLVRAAPADPFTLAQLRLVERAREYVEFNIRNFCDTPPSRVNNSVRRPRAWLTRKESEIFDLLCQGACNKEISRRLFIQESTTKTHLRHIYAKFSVENRRELLALILREGASAAGKLPGATSTTGVRGALRA